jgi:hypothetical protein
MAQRDEHPYREAAGPDERELDAYETNLHRLHRRGQLRLAGAGLLVLLGGLLILWYGIHVERQQEGNEVQFLLPSQIVMVGAIAAALGGILLLVALVSRLRSGGLR